MAALVHVRPRHSPAGARRLLAEVEAAVAGGAELGDRRVVIGELTRDLHRNFARLQSAIVELKAFGASCDPECLRMIRLGEQACAEVLDRLGPLLKQADRLNALLAAPIPPAPTSSG